MKNILEVRKITKNYEGKPLLRGISFQVNQGETLCLLGRSGSGKSTLLRIIAGLEDPDGGQVCWDGEDIVGVPTYRRHFGLMFQDYALFPHLNVAQNVAFGLRMQGGRGSENMKLMNEALERVNMRAFAQRKVTDLSGGEQQRIALARALAPKPRLLMLDEPLAALDRALRLELQQELRALLPKTNIPVIYVTHDQEEALLLGDTLAILAEGQIEQIGTPEEVFQKPGSLNVANFLGMTNTLKGKVKNLDPLVVTTARGDFRPGVCRQQNLQLGKEVTLLLRPIGVSVSAAPSAENMLRGTVADCVFKGDSFEVTIRVEEQKSMRFQLPAALPQGAAVSLSIPSGSINCLEG
jgi:ABC-type Fe3+/spermidine/putrescine transport system ATPase subunit